MRHVLWQTARLLASCALAYGASRAVGLPDGFWALISAVIVTQPGLGDTLLAGRNRVLGTVIGAIAGVLIVALVQHGARAFPLFWIALVPLALLTALWPNLRIACVTLTVVVLIPSAGTGFERPLDRIWEILIGSLASIAVSVVTARADPRGERHD